MAGVGVRFTVTTQRIDFFDQMSECSQAVLDSHADAWAAMMTNPYQFDARNNTPGPYECLAVLGVSPMQSQRLIVQDPRYMLCVLKGEPRLKNH